MSTYTTKITKKEKEILDRIDFEIKYCKEHPDQELTAEFQNGFISGLEQAKRLVAV